MLSAASEWRWPKVSSKHFLLAAQQCRTVINWHSTLQLTTVINWHSTLQLTTVIHSVIVVVLNLATIQFRGPGLPGRPSSSGASIVDVVDDRRLGHGLIPKVYVDKTNVRNLIMTD